MNYLYEMNSKEIRLKIIDDITKWLTSLTYDKFKIHDDTSDYEIDKGGISFFIKNENHEFRGASGHGFQVVCISMYIAYLIENNLFRR